MKNFKQVALTIVTILSMNLAMATNDKPTSYQGQDQTQAQGQLQSQTTNIGIDVNNKITNDVRASAAAFSASSANAKSEAAAVNLTDVNNGGNTLTSSNGGNTQSTIVTDSGKMQYSGSYEVKNVPAVVSGNVYPTSPCMGGTSVGASGVGFGFSVGSSWTDDECGIRETARSFAGLGLQGDALALLCSSKYAAAAPSCKK